jgi:outer membrane autotransporter protein
MDAGKMKARNYEPALSRAGEQNPMWAHSLRRFWGRWGVVMLVGGCALVHVGAAPTSWVHTNGNSSWFTPANWSAGVPTVADDAFVESGTTAFVEGNTAAVADNVYIDKGGLTVGNINPGTLNVAGELAVSANGSGGALNLNYGTISLNQLTVGQNGTYADTSFGTLNLTGTDPTIAMAPSVTVLINSLVTGTNGLTKGGLGTLTLANNNTYSGGTTIAIGTLQVGNGGTSGSLGFGDVLNNGTLVYNRSDDVTVTNFISGTGNFRQAGNGKVTLTADNNYSGGTTISSGTVQVGAGGTTGSLGSGNVTNNGTLAFNRSDAVTVGNLISGLGNLQQLGSNTLTLTANNTYTGTTTINSNGTIQVGNGGTTGTLGSGAVINNGALAFNRSDTLTVSNTISGAGSLTNAGSGTTILMANNTYSGLTVIANGTLQVGNGGSTGSLGTNQVLNHGALAFNRSNDLTVANLISGSGSVTHAGTGTVTLSGTNTYGGGTTVNNGGTLQLRNSSAAGTGDLNLNNGRLRADPALTGGLEIKVGGNYAQGADGTLELGIGGSLAASNQFDRITAAGTATLDGTLHLTSFNNYRAKHSDTFDLIVATNGLTGTFDDFTNDITHSVLLTPELVYTNDRVTLIWEHMSFVNFLAASNVTLTANQKSVAASLDSILSSPDTNDIALINFLDYQGDLTNSLPESFDQIAPEELTAMLVAAFSAMDALGNQFLRRVGDLQSNYRRLYQESLGRRTTTKEAFDTYVNRPWDVYFELPVNSVSVSGDANAAGYDVSANGFTLGADRCLTPNLIVGGAFNYLTSSGDLANGGSVDLNTVSVQGYATWFNPEGLHFEGLVGLGINSYETMRLAVGGAASGDTDGFGFTTLLGGGYNWENGPWQFGPSLSLQYLNASIKEFTESGSLSPLRIESQSQDAAHTQLGFKFRYRHLFPDSWTIITPELQLAWRHDLLDNSISLDSQFASGNGGSFTVTGPEMGRESVIISLGCAVQWRPALNTYLNYTVQRGRSGYDSEFLNLGLRYSF